MVSKRSKVISDHLEKIHHPDKVDTLLHSRTTDLDKFGLTREDFVDQMIDVGIDSTSAVIATILKEKLDFKHESVLELWPKTRTFKDDELSEEHRNKGNDFLKIGRDLLSNCSNFLT